MFYFFCFLTHYILFPSVAKWRIENISRKLRIVKNPLIISSRFRFSIYFCCRFLSFSPLRTLVVFRVKTYYRPLAINFLIFFTMLLVRALCLPFFFLDWKIEMKLGKLSGKDMNLEIESNLSILTYLIISRITLSSLMRKSLKLFMDDPH